MSKNISVKYSESGLNSKRLILNAVVDVMEGSEHGGIVEVSPEVSLEDVETWMIEGLSYKINAGIMTSRNLKNGTTTEYLQAFVG